MKKCCEFCRGNISFIGLSAFWLFALFNPLFKKYDYGGGFPVLLVLGVLLVVVAFFEFKHKREGAFWEKLFLFLFIAALIASFVFSQTRNLGFSEVLAYSSILPLYYFFAHKKNCWSEKFLQIIVIGTVGAVVLGYVMYFFKSEPRFIGPFFNTLYHAHVWPNAFALFLLMSWPVLLLFFEKKGKWASAILVGFVLSGLLLTYSRGAMIVLGGQAALLFVYFLKRLDLKTVFLILLATIFACGLFFEANYFRSFSHDVVDLEERATFDNSEGLTSKQERIDFWRGAIELANEKPLFGWGPFSFRQAYNPIQKTFLGNADHPHNIFLKIAAENGLIALGAFLAFLITVFATVLRRFPKLAKKKKDAVFILGVAIAGGFAHNLIDYNLNFAANLLLLFILIIFVRSLVIGRKVKVKKAFIGAVFAVLIGLISLYEGGLLVLDQMVYDKSFLNNSFYPRNYYIYWTDYALAYDNFDGGLKLLDKQIKLNPLDAQAWYLKGAIHCDEDYEGHDLALCRQNFKKALELNPMNEFEYYRAYVRALIEIGATDEILDISTEIHELLEMYFGYVKNNVHFTAYTSNVEAAAELTDLIFPYLPIDKTSDLLEKKERMLEIADRLRSEKEF